MSKSFVKDPRDVVKPGDIVRVKVLDVDKARKRISLSLRLDDEAGREPARPRAAERGPAKRSFADPETGKAGSSGSAMAEALRRVGFGGNGPRN